MTLSFLVTLAVAVPWLDLVGPLVLDNLAWIVGTPVALLVGWALRKWWPGVAAERQRQIATAARGASIIVGRVADDGQIDWKDHLAAGLKALAEGLEKQGAPPLAPKDAKVAVAQLQAVGVVPAAIKAGDAAKAAARILRN